MLRTLGPVTLAVAILAPQLRAQTPDTTRKVVPLAAVTVTATRSERSTFDTPQPITVIDSAVIREKLPNGAADLFRDVAGLDAMGVGPNQRRPQIRGQRGQRILLLQDGLRLNNARRQQDFGELPALADVTALERVEVVRGPSSVLYGTDAIGGVVNLITRRTPRGLDGVVHGNFTYRYGSTGLASLPQGTLTARYGRFAVSAHASYREAEDYLAPRGSFGSITLADETIVRDSGVRDRSWRFGLGYDLTPSSEIFGRAEFYSAEKAGFGWIDPESYDPGSARIQITYPDQDYKRYTVGYRANALSTFFADRVELSTYVQRNERSLVNDIFVPIAPGASVLSQSFNFTDLRTIGGRLELAKAFGDRATLTYGVDAFRDRSVNTDSSYSVTSGFGPTPITRASNRPSIPNAVFRSAGIFTQLELNPIERLTAVIGSRAQEIFADTKATPNTTAAPVKGSDRTVVWTANTLYRVTDDLNVVASLAEGFRAPNLVERFFDGTATEGNGVQIANAELAAETSLNLDLGLRYRLGPLYAEGFLFRNDIDDAIRAVPTGDTVNARPVFQNRNIGKLRLEGAELTSGVRSESGIDASVSFTRIDGTNVSDPDRPTGDSYSTKWVADLGYRRPSGLFSVGYTARYQGKQKDVIVGANPIGDHIPAFTVHSARADVRLFQRAGVTNRLALVVENIGDRLYAEFPNASFFRPEPGRNISLALVTSF